MKEDIRLGQILTENRRKHGITQEELAASLGVSKAAVSKWETGSTYPDILMLPRIAAYFDLTVDELIGYEPQLNTEEIRKLYCQLAGEFASGPFDHTLKHCREYVRRYFSCYPLLFQLATLLINHTSLAQSSETSGQMIEEALKLYQRVKDRTDNPSLGKEALQMEAYCHLLLHQPEETLKLLDENHPGSGPAEPILASAYQMTGDIRSAKKILQVGMYKNILALFNLTASYMKQCQNDLPVFQENCRRLSLLEEMVHMDSLHPGIMLTCYVEMAQGWMMHGEKERALEYLEKYTRLACGNIYPLRLHGDEYFTLMDEWFADTLSLADYPPRNDSVIRRSITQAVTDNPAFSSLNNDSQFQHMIALLKQNEKRK